MQNEIKDYLRHSKQVKKYDSLQKMQRDNIKAKNKKKFKKNDISENNNNIINKKSTINEDNENENENEEEEDDNTHENENNPQYINNDNKLVKKMDKLNFLRNLAKRAKIENQKIDYDSQLPEKMKEEVYKKGISNILNLSKFLKHKLQNKESAELKKEDISPNKKNKKNNLQNEIKDYLRHSKQVKKYDSLQKMQRDNIKAKNKKKIKKNDIFENNNNIINEDINEDNFNNNENENENFNSNEIENNNFNDNQNENNQQNFIEEEQFQGQNAKIEENNNYNEVNDEENKNQEEIMQDNENPSPYKNKNNLKRNKNQLKEIPKKIKKDLNNNQISDTK